MSEEKWEKRITEKDLKGDKTIDEWVVLLDKYQLQCFKDHNLKDADFEIIEPKQLPESTNKNKQP
jgi:hypothetical protein